MDEKGTEDMKRIIPGVRIKRGKRSMASRKMVQQNGLNLNILLFCCYMKVVIEGKWV